MLKGKCKTKDLDFTITFPQVAFSCTFCNLITGIGQAYCLDKQVVEKSSD